MPEVHSRTLEDAGTITSVHIPWNTCGASQAAIMGVPVISYIPSAFFNLISQLMNIFFATFNMRIKRIAKEEGVNFG